MSGLQNTAGQYPSQYTGGINSTPYYYPPAPPEPRWPNQMCELLAEAGRLLLEENSKFKARIEELELELRQRDAIDRLKAAGSGGQ